jgi:Cof subfamily protein (haloacid dehalogenase superfamily)
MTASIRLLISDIDGTLVRHDKSLSDGNVAAARRLADAGIALSLISARPMSGMQWIAEKLEIDGPIGAFNGGTLFDVNGVTAPPQRIDPAIAARLLALLDDAGIDVWLFADDQWYARNADNPHVPREILSSGRHAILRDDLAALCNAADKIVGVSDDAALLKAVEAKAIAEAAGNATIALSQPYFLDTTALLANKGDGVAAIAAAAGVPLDQVAVIGDMANDLPMFARTGLSIAMGQAPEHVRHAADWVTGSNEDDGVAQAIDRLIAERR